MSKLSRRSFLVAGAASCATVALSACQIFSPARRPPNLLVLLADDLRADVLGFAGDPLAETPYLDRLARRSVRFDNNFVTTSICPTSRASLLTGQYASRHRIWGFGEGLSAPQIADSYPALLRGAGYHSGLVGKYGLALPAGAPVDEAFDLWRPLAGHGNYWAPHRGERHLSESLAQQGVEFIQTAPADRPFVLSIHFKAPHVQDEAEAVNPYQPHPADLAAHQRQVFPRPATATPAHFARLPSCLQTSESRRRWRTRFSESLDQNSRRRYYALVTGLDRAIGRVLDALDETGRRSDTVVVFSSDNGVLMGEHGLAGKWFGFEESIRTPLLIQPVDPPRHRVVGALTLNVDLAPTLLALAGLPPAARTQGRSLVPLWSERAPESRSELLYEHRFEPPPNWRIEIPASEGLRTSRYKYLRYYGCPEPNEQLFDLRNDPREEHNLAATIGRSFLDEMRERTRVLRTQAL